MKHTQDSGLKAGILPPDEGKIANAATVESADIGENEASKVVGYRAGECRNNPKALAHTYAIMSDDKLWPMCGYGWNRSDGMGFSIFRGSPGTEGDCKVCSANVAKGRPPVFDGFPHKTVWL